MVITASDPIEHEGVSWANQIHALQQFGFHLSLFFQIQDDYLDCFNPQAGLGKSRSSDAANHKNTFASIHDQASLLALIQQHRQQAQQSLKVFAESADGLVGFLHYLSKV